MPDTTDTTGLEDQVAELWKEIAALRAELATEVRTRRLVVVDEDRVERLTTNHATDPLRSFELTMQTASGDAHLALRIVDDPDGDRASIGVGVVRGGDVTLNADKSADGPLTAYMSIEEVEPRRMMDVSASGLEVSEDFEPAWVLTGELTREVAHFGRLFSLIGALTRANEEATA